MYDIERDPWGRIIGTDGGDTRQEQGLPLPTAPPGGSVPVATGGGGIWMPDFSTNTYGYGAGGAGSGHTSRYQASSPMVDEWSARLSAELESILGEKASRYTPEVMEEMTGQQLRQRESSRETGMDAAYEDMVRRGVFRSPAAGAAAIAVERGAQSDFSRNVTAIHIQKVNADHQDRMEALDRAQTFLNQQMDYAIRREMTAVEWERISAQLALGFSNIDAQLRIAEANYEAELYRINTSAGMWAMSQ